MKRYIKSTVQTDVATRLNKMKSEFAEVEEYEQLLNSLPIGPIAKRVQTTNSSGYTSHGGYSSRYTTLIDIVKLDDDMCQYGYRKESIHDTALSLKYNNGEFVSFDTDKSLYTDSTTQRRVWDSKNTSHIESATDVFEDIAEIDQEFTSENTSINSNKLPAIFHLVQLESGTVNVDVGGGRFDNVADYLSQYNVINLVYDPYNRTPEHNKEVVNTVRSMGGADTSTCSNVLNVIKEPEARDGVISNCKKLVKPGGTCYFTVYEGNGTGEGSPTKAGYQTNMKTVQYMDEISKIFSPENVTRKGKLIIAKN